MSHGKTRDILFCFLKYHFWHYYGSLNFITWTLGFSTWESFRAEMLFTQPCTTCTSHLDSSYSQWRETGTSTKWFLWPALHAQTKMGLIKKMVYWLRQFLSLLRWVLIVTTSCKTVSPTSPFSMCFLEIKGIHPLMMMTGCSCNSIMPSALFHVFQGDSLWSPSLLPKAPWPWLMTGTTDINYSEWLHTAGGWNTHGVQYFIFFPL